ncbi:hypothetical protein D3C71_1617580 [compost metagenome]
MAVQQRGQLQGIALGLGQPLGATVGTGTGDQPGQRLTGFTRQAQALQTPHDFGGIVRADIRQQQTLPGCEAQTGITELP